MKEPLDQLEKEILDRKESWLYVKNPKHPTSVFVCNKRIQKLDEALQLISEIREIDELTKVDK